MSTPRPDLRPPESVGDEKTMMVTFLDYLRESVIAKAAGVSDQAARTPGVGSGTSLAWLLRHLAEVELGWFVWSYAGVEIPVPPDPIVITETDTLDSLIGEYRAAVTRANAVIAECEDLHVPGLHSLRETPPPSMRWILLHMIEETGRHAGHADILREQIDGATGR